MKSAFLFAIAALLLTATVKAQTTVDSIKAKYHLQPMPEALTIEKTFPVLGSYQLSASDSSTAAAGTVSITLDSSNKGLIWVEGLPEGRIKASLKKSPSTYRILPQKNEAGKLIPEGTLVFDATTNTLNIALGKAFDDADPNAVFTMNTLSSNAAQDSEVKVKTKTPASKTKTKTKAPKLTFYTASKAMPVMDNMNSTMPQDSTNQQQNVTPQPQQ
jgi:hypothetical protein